MKAASFEYLGQLLNVETDFLLEKFFLVAYLYGIPYWGSVKKYRFNKKLMSKGSTWTGH